MQELVCPDKKGFYFFRRFSWQKCAGRIFLLLYTILTDIKLATKFGFIQLGKIDRIAIWHISSLRLAINGVYVLYRFFVAYEAMRAKVWWKVAISTGKIIMVILGIIITAQNISFVPFLLTVRAISLGIDSIDVAKKTGVL